ncbi:hypothetical protein [Microvirga terricola]|uniref:Uncharacterized protein n=1 Tax=Microvirga terricola TaxID=2719797 RepID=A0ABX0V6D4_9HYPH|nr:hypothetical protein [Microvirga terricola]NIX75392.1 hypothetical protein [Microvirga terricola]
MVATKDRTIPTRGGDAYGYSVKGGVRLFKRTLVALTAAGLAVPAGTAGAVAIAGVASHHADNREGLDGDGKLRCEKGAFPFDFAAAPTFADIGKAVYAVDDNTVSLDNSGGTRLRAGTLEGFEDGLIWIRV